MYEGRFAKLFNPVTGVLTWMSNPAQPSFVWQLYSHDLEPNASLFAVRKACEPLHIQMNQNDFHVMVINSTPAAVEGLTATVRVFAGRRRMEISAGKRRVSYAGECGDGCGGDRVSGGFVGGAFCEGGIARSGKRGWVARSNFLLAGVAGSAG